MSDTDAMGRLREELERKALESASGWFNSAPEMALALVRVANEVREPVALQALASKRSEAAQESCGVASDAEPDPKARLREASALVAASRARRSVFQRCR